MNWILKVRGVAKAYPDAAGLRAVLEGLSFTASAGEIVALTGPSGSGKSTLLNLLAGTLRPDAGEIVLRFDGREHPLTGADAAELTAIRRRQIGYVFQFFNLVPTLTVRENVLLPLELNQLPELTAEALERLTTLGLGERLDVFPAILSGGERQRTAIARALAHRPVLVLADEPTGNLDAANAERVADLFVDQVRRLDCVLVMATHNESIARRADQILRLDR